MRPYKRIFAAIDGGSTQEAVIERTLTLAHDNKAEVLFGHVISSVPYEASSINLTALAEDRKERIEETMHSYFESARADENIKSVDIQVRVGRILETLVDRLISPFKPDLIVCSARGLSRLQYLFSGSISVGLIRNMQCDVLVVDLEKTASEQEAQKDDD